MSDKRWTDHNGMPVHVSAIDESDQDVIEASAMIGYCLPGMTYSQMCEARRVFALRGNTMTPERRAELMAIVHRMEASDDA